MRNTLPLILLNSFIVILVLLSNAMAFENCNYSDFQGWKDCFVKEKLSTRLNGVSVEALQKANYVGRVLELDKKQPEKKLTFAEYRKLIALPDKITQAVKYYRDNREFIDHIAKEYSIEPEVIVALVGVESSFGLKQGNFNIIDALATLSYDGRRKDFFSKELIHALTIINNENLSYEDFNGSWAGAMGQCQFMPSSFISYAVDFDNDGIKDIWNCKEDVFASIANYLVSSGWKIGQTEIKSVKKVEKSDPTVCKNNSDICDYDAHYKMIRFKNTNGKLESYLVGNNFKVLMKWNRSAFFGVSVLLIAEGVRNEIEKQS